MSKYLSERVKKIGQSPGTLSPAKEPSQKVGISLIGYDDNQFIEKNDLSLAECLEFRDKVKVLWISISGISDTQTIQSIGTSFNLHPLLLEDIVTVGQRSKLDDYKDYIFIVMHTLKLNPDTDKIEDNQISLVLGHDFLISFVESECDLFNPVRERLRKENSRSRQKGIDYLCYSLIDCIVDNYFIVLEAVDGKLEKLEGELMGEPKAVTASKIQKVKRQITQLRKAVWPLREVISQFRRLDSHLVNETTKLYMQDVYDHTIQVIDNIENFRDIAGGMLDIYLSNISFRMNEIMKVLTIVATIFVPLTFIASIYGMNFDYIPELHMKWGYPIVLFAMLLIAVGMLIYFRRKKWI